jgi:hypothetical protein
MYHSLTRKKNMVVRLLLLWSSSLGARIQWCVWMFGRRLPNHIYNPKITNYNATTRLIFLQWREPTVHGRLWDGNQTHQGYFWPTKRPLGHGSLQYASSHRGSIDTSVGLLLGGIVMNTVSFFYTTFLSLEK